MLEVQVPEFFFHLTNGETVRDHRGTRLRTVEDARALAEIVAAELGRNRSADELRTLALCVTDETAREVFRTKLVNLQYASSADAMVRAARSDDS
jgi:hypothetical protein